jgi:ABC-2 type transport system ATP-binding protein
VFLSSHILSEVEHVCDSVGILRAGKLVRVARLEELRAAGETSLEEIFLSYYSDTDHHQKALPE